MAIASIYSGDTNLLNFKKYKRAEIWYFPDLDQ